MVDSDCVPVPGWIERLAAHLADPLVAVAAPRIVPLPTVAGSTPRSTATTGSAAASTSATARPASRPLTRVAYVPDRRARGAPGRAARRRPRSTTCSTRRCTVGEDVDLVWRLHDAGWRIRYDPAVHDAARRAGDLARRCCPRRFRYGTSAAPLAQRHPARHARRSCCTRWPALTVAALLARRPLRRGCRIRRSVVSASAHAAPGRHCRRGRVVPAMLTAVTQTWLGARPLRRAVRRRRCWSPRSSRRARRHGAAGAAALAAASLLLGPGWPPGATRRPALDPARFTAASIADDIAYGAGVWVGAVHHRTLTAVRPVIARPQHPIGPPPDRSSS